MSRTTFESLPWRSRSQRDFAANSCPAHKIVIWSRISKIFHRNDHHIETMCRAQQLGRYLEVQGHSATLQQIHVRPITLLFEVIWSQISKIFHRNDHHIETTCRAQHLGRYPEGQGHSMTLQQNRVRPITLFFEVGFWKYFTEMITILRPHVARTNWVTSLKVKVTAWPCIKVVSSP